MSLLEMDSVTRTYGRRSILRDVHLRVDDGDRIALRGPNGSGKTTLLRIAAGTLQPTSGEVRIGGATGVEARRQIAFVAQDAPVYRELTVLEHVQFAARLHGQDDGRGANLPLLAAAGLAKQSHLGAAQISRGQRQRLAIAAAQATGARLLILDEPFTALDDEGTQWCRSVLDEHEGAVLAAIHGNVWSGNRVATIGGGSVT